MPASSALHPLRIFILLMTSIFLTACGGGGGGGVPGSGGGGGGGGNDPVIVSVSISPTSPVVQVNGTIQLSLTAHFSDNSTGPITSGINWSSDDLSVASAAAGLLNGIQVGQAVLTATYNGFVDTASATVQEGLSGGVLISEVGSGNSGNGLWFEIYNGSGSPVQLSDYSVRMLQSGVPTSYSLPAKTVLSGSYLIVLTRDFSDSLTGGSGYVGNPNVVLMNPHSGYWNQSGFLELTKNSATVDFVRFGGSSVNPVTGGEWISGAAPSLQISGYGLSIARDGNNSDTNNASDWNLREFPTMGGANDIDCADDDDADGIPDCSEQPGSTYAGLPLYDWGARTGQKDLFIELDYMDPSIKQALGEHVDGMVPQREALDKIVAKFAEHNIAVHFDVGDLFDQAAGTDAQDYDLGGGGQVPFANSIFIGAGAIANVYQYKAQYMAVNKRSLFYYLVLGYSQTGSEGSSGVSEILGNDVLVTIGAWGLSRGIATGPFTATENTNRVINFQSATIMHEFGHALGMHHGGAGVDAENFEPNYLSTMNYLYQLQGLPTVGSNEGDRYYLQNYQGQSCDGVMTNAYWQSYANFKIDYSDGTGIDFNETVGVFEAEGLGRAGSTGVDFDCDGNSSSTVAMDLNPSCSGACPNGTQLDDHNDWGNLQYFFAFSQNKLANGASLYSAQQQAETTLPLFTTGHWSDEQPLFQEPEMDLSKINTK